METILPIFVSPRLNLPHRIMSAETIRVIILTLLALLSCDRSAATISESFRQFVKSRYGKNVADLLAREDLGTEGSYGGGEHIPGQRTARYPVIFVHGMMTSAGTTQPMASFFQSSGGYSDEELYATTFGPKGSLLLSGEVECQFAQSIRLVVLRKASEPLHSCLQVYDNSRGRIHQQSSQRGCLLNWSPS